MNAVEHLAVELLDAMLLQLKTRPEIAEQFRAALGASATTGQDVGVTLALMPPDGIDASEGPRDLVEVSGSLPRSIDRPTLTGSAMVARAASVLSPDVVGSQADVVGQITTAAVAETLGKTNPRAARDWCRRHGIALRRDGKFNWVDIAEVRRTLAGLSVSRSIPTGAEREDAVRDATAKLMRRK